MKIPLPVLANYLEEFKFRGVKFPLTLVPRQLSGLLSELPTAPLGKIGWPWTEETDPGAYQSNKRWPKVTIVTPSYNQGTFLEETIRSVLLQNYPNLEYIIIDGGSSDNSEDILQKYSPWLSFWHSKKDNGQSHAINLGFSLASGTYLAWINSDDFYLRNTFLKVISKFLDSKVDFIYGYAVGYNTKEKTFNVVKVLPLYDYFLRIPTLAQPSCFWHSRIHQPLWEELHGSLDYELWLRLVRGNSRILIKEPLAVANIHDEAKTVNPKLTNIWDRDHQLICSETAHGRVTNWRRMMILYKFFLLINRLVS